MNRLTILNALQSLKDEKEPFKELFSHGSLSIEIYKPEGADLQSKHAGINTIDPAQ